MRGIRTTVESGHYCRLPPATETGAGHDHGASPNPGSSGFDSYQASSQSPLPSGGRYGNGVTYSRARTAVILGMLGIVPFSVLTGIPAVFLGLRALRDIKASEGTLKGRGAAWCAIVLGVISVLVFAAFLAHM